MLHGSCLCGRVAYEINGPLTDALNCHCSMCRKSQGAAYRSRATVQVSDFAWTRGESEITWYSSSPGSYRGFCGACGSPLLSRFDATPEVYGLPLGALDDDPGVRPACHVHVADKAPWHEITDTLPQHAGPLP
ncbi:GFA family protein [Pseudomonadota bacterium AL_CKDN230030165-1A_HGKHYDSX7]